MIRRRNAKLAVLGLSLCVSAIAHGGGRGGDSSMNPFTGDSYAYFNGGHNLGEQGMNIPWRKAAPQATTSNDRSVPNATAKSPTPMANSPTRAFQSLDASTKEQQTDTKKESIRQ